MPGPIDSPTSVGPHRLIQQGAELVQDVEDIFQEFPGLAKGQGSLFGVPSRVGTGGPAAGTAGPALASGAAPEDPLLALLGSDPLSLEELLRATGLAPPRS